MKITTWFWNFWLRACLGREMFISSCFKKSSKLEHLRNQGYFEIWAISNGDFSRSAVYILQLVSREFELFRSGSFMELWIFIPENLRRRWETFFCRDGISPAKIDSFHSFWSTTWFLSRDFNCKIVTCNNFGLILKPNQYENIVSWQWLRLSR